MAEMVLIADDHPLFREALKRAVESVCGEATCTREADSLASLQTLVPEHPDADLLLLDLNMPGVTGFSALAYIRGTHPAVPVVIVSATEEPGVMRRALAHGAAGFIPKSSPVQTIAAAIHAVLDGDLWLPEGIAPDDGRLAAEERSAGARLASLTPQQFRVLMMLSQGLLNKQIAYELEVSEATVKAHVTAIMKKLGVSNRTQAVVEAARLGLERAESGEDAP